MNPDQARTEARALQVLINTQPVIDVLSWLNARTDFRFTVLGRLDGDTLHSVLQFDRMRMPAKLPPTAVAGSYFDYALSNGEFAVENSLRDERLIHNAYRKLIRSFHGVPLAAPGKPPIGVLYHYDVLPHKLPPGEVELLKLAASWLAPSIAGPI